MPKNDAKKKDYTAAERRKVIASIKLTDECCATCNHGWQKASGLRMRCSEGLGLKYPYEGKDCQSYDRNTFLKGER